MKNLHKILFVGLTGLLLSCSNEQSNGPDFTGATTEPSTSQYSMLTDKQKELLEKSFLTLYDTILGVKENGIVIPIEGDSSIYIENPSVELVYDYSVFGKLMFPFDSMWDTTFYTQSLDRSRSCQVYVQSKESGVELEQTLDLQDSHGKHHYSSIIAVKVVDVDGTPVLMKTVGHASYWGYGTSCSEFLNQFKKSCEESNGIFEDYEDGCRNSSLSLACSMLMPEGKTEEDIVSSYTQEYRNVCKEDSIKYAPFDTEVGPQQACQVVSDETGDHYYGDCLLFDDDFDEDLWRRDSAWRMGITRTLDAYVEQFAVYQDVVDGMTYYYNHKELINDDVLAYNSFPEAEVANAYREEGIYHLPDSLLAIFFPTAANNPRAYTTLQGENGDMTYYIIVLKDVGTKGHALNKIDASGIYVRDILKSGESCPEDNAEYYSVFLIRGSTEWDISGKQIVRNSYVSPLWNCNDPESLERVEPYGEWTNRDRF